MEVPDSNLIVGYLPHAPDVALLVCNQLSSSLLWNLNLLVAESDWDDHVAEDQQVDIVLERRLESHVSLRTQWKIGNARVVDCAC